MIAPSGYKNMNHSFVKSLTSDTCAKCKRSEKDHTDKAQCEACPNEGRCDLLGDILLCETCLKKEYSLAVQKAKESSANFDQAKINTAVINPIGAILHSVEVDSALEVKEDFFNAETTSIVELKTALFATVDSLATPDEKKKLEENANFELAKMIQQRYTLFREKLIEMKAAEQNLLSRQRAIAQYLNDLAGKISAEKRAEIKLGDINYKPSEAKPKTSTVAKPRVTVEEKMAVNVFNNRLQKAAAQLVADGVCKDTEEGLKVAKSRGLGISMEAARELVRQTIGKI